MTAAMLTMNAVFATGACSDTDSACMTRRTASIVRRLHDALKPALRLLLSEADRIPGPVGPFALLSLPDQRQRYCLPLVLRLAAHGGDAAHRGTSVDGGRDDMIVLESVATAAAGQGQVQVGLILLSPNPPKAAPSLHFRLSPSSTITTATSWLPTALHGHPIHPHSSATSPTRLRAQLGTRSFWVDVWPPVPADSPLGIVASTTQFIPAPPSPNSFQDASQLAATIQDVGVRGQQELVQRVASWLMRQLSVLLAVGAEGGRRVEHALISGSTGSGKSLLANAIAATTGLSTIHISCTSTPNDLLPLTAHLSSSPNSPTPTVIIIDHIDSLSPTQSDLLAHLLDSTFTPSSPHLTLALTSHALPAPLARRFPAHFALHPPRTPAARLAILSSMLPTLPVTLTPAVAAAVHAAHGLAPGDLARAAGLATTHALSTGTRVADHLPDALRRVKPMAVVELAMDVPFVDLERDVYALDEAIRDVQVAVLDPLARVLAGDAGVEPAKGMLIHGPPGTGKSLLAMGVVNRLGFACVPLDSSRVLSKIVGASESAIARAFAAARAAAPCVLLLDQVETLAAHRGSASMGQEGTGDRIVTCLLTELDGILAKRNQVGGAGVFVIAMSSNIAQIDSALLRPGRLDVHIHLAQPQTLAQAQQLVRGFAGRHPHGLSQQELDEQVAARCVGMTGAQIKGVWERAAVRAIREERSEVGLDHLVGVLEEADG